MNNAAMTAIREIASAMTSTNNYAVQIKVSGKWQMVIDKLTKNQADELSARYQDSRVVKVA